MAQTNTLVDMRGKTYGRLTVLSYAGDRKWLCRCECGKEKTVQGKHLRNGYSTSCGCYRAEYVSQRRTTHGKSRTPEYRIWLAMIRRCTVPHAHNYDYYGGRGITVCDRWLNSFEDFYADMGPKPGPDYTIEREKNDQGYKPGNCHWGTWTEQANNRRKPSC